MSRRWVVISPTRTKRPNGDFPKKSHLVCPFCPGNEKETPPELLRFGGGEANRPGWKVRVVPNKFPITDIHEVIIHSPSCEHDIGDLSESQIELIFQAYRLRYNFFRDKGQVMIFCNHGEHAGASLRHPHSQLVVIPSQINLDTLSREPLNNRLESNQFFDVYCPDFSQWPYELWIAPKKEKTFFGDITDSAIKDLAVIMKNSLKSIRKIYDDSHDFGSIPFGYNYYIHPKENWYIRIVPRFVHRAGFELGTGLSVNVIDPYEASLRIRDLEGKLTGVMKKLKRYRRA
ncbi:DUF4931 domain-containing protein [Candidatus Roizmanbacteria bacterium]|nr:DUF4931 domain-containing protein [Candidatus Roizmanbacteria bacterium]